MIITIKPHSSIQKFFRGTNLKADVNTYSDILEYLHAIHPDFITYIKKQAENGLQESFTFLDKNLRELSKDEMFMRKPREDDTIHIVPSIVGGGGKRGVFAILAVAALVFFAPTLLASAGAFGGSALTAAAAPALLGTTTIGTLASTLGLNLALMGISMLFAPKTPKAETSRDNDSFGSLVNTTASGTPIALHYGLVRVGGQLVTGYTKTVEVPPGEEITMDEIITL